MGPRSARGPDGGGPARRRRPRPASCTATVGRGRGRAKRSRVEEKSNMRNTHERWWPVAPEKVGPLLDSLASEDDRLWPVDDWPPMTFHRPLAVGATGGHGSMTYTVVGCTPGRTVTFELGPGLGLRGHHRFVVEPQQPGGALRDGGAARGIRTRLRADAVDVAVDHPLGARRRDRGRAGPLPPGADGRVPGAARTLESVGAPAARQAGPAHRAQGFPRGLTRSRVPAGRRECPVPGQGWRLRSGGRPAAPPRLAGPLCLPGPPRRAGGACGCVRDRAPVPSDLRCPGGRGPGPRSDPGPWCPRDVRPPSAATVDAGCDDQLQAGAANRLAAL